ncbi:hypothetical protein [Mycolicibacterium nivoides]|uniref:Uncharacterized protein n=1 Tax=Mycolicibacterium nivoides TaxID=2487344 RepID=A0ABW9LB68_9MYCO
MPTDFDIPPWAALALASGTVFGSEQQGGYHTAVGDVLVDKTADGVPVAKLWDDLRDLLDAWRQKQDALTSLLAFQATDIAEAIPQTLAKFAFEEASEFGVPKAGQAGDSLLIGYDFRGYDRASRFTWKFLRDAAARQIDHDYSATLEADQRVRSGMILRRVMSPTQGLSPENQRRHRGPPTGYGNARRSLTSPTGRPVWLYAHQ